MFTIPTKDFKDTEEDDYLKAQIIADEFIKSEKSDVFDIFVAYDKTTNTYSVRVNNMKSRKMDLSPRLAMFIVCALKERIPKTAYSELHWSREARSLFTVIKSDYAHYQSKLL